MEIIDRNSYKAKFKDVKNSRFFELNDMPMIKINESHFNEPFNCVNLRGGYLSYVMDHEIVTVYPNAYVSKS